MPYARVKNELPLIPGYSEGAIAYAPDAADAPLNECICYINPEQSGSGDPSPSNVRPITGHTELNLVQKDGNDTVVHTYTTDLGTTVYGGTLDVVSGVLTNKYYYVKVPYVESQGTDQNLYFYRKGLNPTGVNTASGGVAISNMFGVPSSTGHHIEGTILVTSNGTALHLTPLDQTIDTVTKMNTWLSNNDVYICYELATPTETQLTPQEVKSLLGGNNIYHDCNGDTKITYIRRLDS